MRNTRGRKLSIGTAAAAALAMAAGATSAGLNIDLRATAVNGQPLPVGSTPRRVFVQNIGDVVSFDIFAVVTGTNAFTVDDRIVSVSGSFISTPFTNPPGTHLLGHLRTGLVPTVTDPNTGEILTPGFDGAGSSVGFQQDLDGDGDLDVGSNVDSDSANFWRATYIIPEGTVAGSNSPTTGGRRVGFGTFIVGNGVLLIDLGTYINFDGRNFGSAAQYIQDGVSIQEPSIDGFFPILVSGTNFDPEPACLTWAVGAFGLMRRRPR